MKKIKLIFIFVLTIVLFSGCDLLSSKSDGDLYKNVIKINIEVKDYGTMSFDLYPDIAPITVNNFVSLVKDGFYDGLSFHRVMPGFMIQGGDPTGTGKGGITQKITGEFNQNGITNDLKHERGVISMARGNDYNSASCQFFIMHKTDPTIDGYYAAFGRITKGIEIVDKIVENTKTENKNGTVLKENQPIINRIYVVEG